MWYKNIDTQDSAEVYRAQHCVVQNTKKSQFAWAQTLSCPLRQVSLLHTALKDKIVLFIIVSQQRYASTCKTIVGSMYNISVISMEWNQSNIYFVHTNYLCKKEKKHSQYRQIFPNKFFFVELTFKSIVLCTTLIWIYFPFIKIKGYLLPLTALCNIQYGF